MAHTPHTYTTGETITAAVLNQAEQDLAAATSRANHTGTQAASTVTGLATVATSGAYTDLSGKPTIPAAATNATTAAPGLVQLAGDLGGTATAPTVTAIGGVSILLSDTRPGSPATGLVRIGLAVTGTADTTAPTVPTGLTVTPGNAQNVLAWTASTDAVGVTGYKVRRGGTVVGTPTTTSYTDTGLTNGTAYSYTVSAVDAAGNESAQTSAVTGTPTSGADTTAPTAPTNLAAGTPTSTTIPLTWTASTDAVGVVAYDVYNSGTLLQSGLTGTSGTVTGLTASTAYVLTLKARDAAGNVSAASNSVSVSTAAAAGATTVAADTFTRADQQNLGTSSGGQTWTVIGGRFDVASNQAKIGSYGAVGPVLNGGATVIDTGASNVTISCDFPTVASQPGLIFRYVDSSNYLYVGTGTVGKVSAGSSSVLGTFPTAVVSGDTVTVVLSGSSITVKKTTGGTTTTAATATDSLNSTATKHGIALLATGSVADRWDNFLVTTP